MSPAAPSQSQSHSRLPRRRAVLVAILTAVALAAAVFAVRSAVAPETASRGSTLQPTLDGLVTGHARIAPGVTAYVAGPHGTWSGAAGWADVAGRVPMRAEDRMRLESVSKMWTAALILRLVAQGRMALDDTVERRLPGVLPYGERITVRQLLDHTSGIVDTNDIMNVPELYLRKVRSAALRARLLAVGRRLSKDPAYEFPSRTWVDFAAALPLVHPPGKAYHYSNIGYDVAGLVAERVGRADLATLLRREIITPLGLRRAAYDPRSAIGGSHAQGYGVAADGRLTDTTRWTEGLGAGGGVVADAADEGRFLRALMGGGLLPAPQRRALTTPSAVTHYGLGVALDETVCGVAYSHSGGGDGFTTDVLVSGDGRRVAVLLLNGRTADAHGDRVAMDAARELYCEA